MAASIKHIALGFCLMLSLNARGQADFRAIDRHALKAPPELFENLPALTAYLVEPAKNDLAKVRAIYVWITRHISYDEEAYQNGNKRINRNIADILRRRRAVCFGYAQLVQAMCAEAGLQAELISGYSKGTLTAKPDLEEADHAWNALRIDNRWHLLDATWDGSLIHENNDFVLQDKRETYFLASPLDFVLDHLPNLPMWQLLDCPVSPQLFGLTSDSIRHFISTSAPCYNYADSIRLFLSLETPERRLWEAGGAYRFNPTQSNRENLGHSLMDYAGLRSELAETLQGRAASTDSLTRLQDEIIDLCRRAFTLMTPYDWQKELYINALLNQAVNLYQQTDRAKSPLPLYRQALDHLAAGESILTNLPPDSYFATYARRQCNLIREAIEDAMGR